MILKISMILLFLCSSYGETSLMDSKSQNLSANNKIVLVDLDGDNVEESITFKMEDRNINLVVDNQEVSIPLDGTIIEEEPFTHSVVWNTNKIGTKTELWVYKYTGHKLEKVWDNERSNKGMTYIISDYNYGNVKLEIPQYSLTTEIPR